MILNTISVLIQLCIYVIFAHAIMSMLLATGMINLQNSFVAQLWGALNQILEPFYKPIRRFVAPINGIDFSPIILLVIITILRTVIGL